MLLAMELCNDATLEQASDGSLHATGSLTEVALARAAQQLLGETAWKDKYPRIAEVPFDSQRKRMATAHQTPEGQNIVFVKGAPDVVLPFCSRIMTGEEAEPLGDAAR
jgi:Ca2+-transporting ATPase